jgi:hypothetical protein
MFVNRRDFCKATFTSAAAVGVLSSVSSRSVAAVYSKTGYVQEMTPALVDAVMEEPGTLALVLSGGAIADIAPTDTALAHRSESFLLQISAEWQDASQNDRKRAEVHAAWDCGSVASRTGFIPI